MSGQDIIGIVIAVAFVALMIGVGIYSKAERTKAAAKKAAENESSSTV